MLYGTQHHAILQSKHFIMSWAPHAKIPWTKVLMTHRPHQQRTSLFSDKYSSKLMATCHLYMFTWKRFLKKKWKRGGVKNYYFFKKKNNNQYDTQWRKQSFHDKSVTMYMNKGESVCIDESSSYIHVLRQGWIVHHLYSLLVSIHW